MEVCDYIVGIMKNMSNDKLARTIQVRLPTVKRKMKPKAHIRAGDHLILPP